MLAGLVISGIRNVPPGFCAGAGDTAARARSARQQARRAHRIGDREYIVSLPEVAARGSRLLSRSRGLLVEPDILHAPAVEPAVGHRRQPLDLRLQQVAQSACRRSPAATRPPPACVRAARPAGGASAVSASTDCCVDQLVGFRVAIAGVSCGRRRRHNSRKISGRDRRGRLGDRPSPSRVILAQQLREIDRRCRPARARRRYRSRCNWMISDHCGIAIARDIARRQLDREPVVGAVAELAA